MADLPLPVPDEATAPFWDYCRAGELRIQRCVQCGVFHHPRSRCAAIAGRWSRSGRR